MSLEGSTLFLNSLKSEKEQGFLKRDQLCTMVTGIHHCSPAVWPNQCKPLDGTRQRWHFQWTLPHWGNTQRFNCNSGVKLTCRLQGNVGNISRGGELPQFWHQQSRGTQAREHSLLSTRLLLPEWFIQQRLPNAELWGMAGKTPYSPNN